MNNIVIMSNKKKHEKYSIIYKTHRWRVVVLLYFSEQIAVCSDAYAPDFRYPHLCYNAIELHKITQNQILLLLMHNAKHIILFIDKYFYYFTQWFYKMTKKY